jgi:hypothetical protein
VIGVVIVLDPGQRTLERNGINDDRGGNETTGEALGSELLLMIGYVQGSRVVRIIMTVQTDLLDGPEVHVLIPPVPESTSQARSTRTEESGHRDIERVEIETREPRQAIRTGRSPQRKMGPCHPRPIRFQWSKTQAWHL